MYCTPIYRPPNVNGHNRTVGICLRRAAMYNRDLRARSTARCRTTAGFTVVTQITAWKKRTQGTKNPKSKNRKTCSRWAVGWGGGGGDTWTSGVRAGGGWKKYLKNLRRSVIISIILVHAARSLQYTRIRNTRKHAVEKCVYMCVYTTGHDGRVRTLRRCSEGDINTSAAAAARQGRDSSDISGVDATRVYSRKPPQERRLIIYLSGYTVASEDSSWEEVKRRSIGEE